MMYPPPNGYGTRDRFSMSKKRSFPQDPKIPGETNPFLISQDILENQEQSDGTQNNNPECTKDHFQ